MTKEVWQPSELFPTENLLLGSEEDLFSPETFQTYARVMHACGQIEPRMAIFVYGMTAQPQLAREVYERTRERLGFEVWLPSEETIRQSYLRRGFCQAGFAEETVGEINGRHRVFFQSNRDGREILKPVAAQLLYSAAESETSAVQIFGGGHSATDSKSYMNRTDVLLALYQGSSSRSQLTRRLGLNKNTVKANLFALRDTGLIDYYSVDPEETTGWVAYKVVGDLRNVPHSSRSDRLVRGIVEFLRVNKLTNARTIVEALGRKDEQDVIHVLSEFVQGGVLERVYQHDGDHPSYAQIVEKGRALVEDTVLPILGTCARNPIYVKLLAERQEEVEANPDIAARAIGQYMRVAGRLKRQSVEELGQNILAFIKENGPSRPKDIKSGLGKTPNRGLDWLVDTGQVIKLKDGKAVYYFLPGMDRPEREKTVIVYEYQPLAEPLPPTGRPREEYHAELETVEFWEGLIVHLEALTVAATENSFYNSYKPDNTEWNDSDRFITGIYHNYILALRNLGVERPYAYIREYAPQDEAVRTTAEKAQALVQERLIPTVERISFAERLEQLENPDFWLDFKEDLETFESGVSFYSFLLNFSTDNVAASYLRDSEGEKIFGKYYLFLNSFKKNHLKLLDLPETAELPAEIQASAGKTITRLFYNSAPYYIRELLRERFPGDFESLPPKQVIDERTIEEEEILAEAAALEIVRRDEITLPDEDIFAGIEVDDAVGMYLAEARRTPLLTKEEEFTLMEQIEKIERAELQLSSMRFAPQEQHRLLKIVELGEMAREHLIKANQRLVIWEAKKHLGQGVPLLDLIQEGNIGLMRAIEKSDHSRGYRFSTYAVWWIRQAMVRAIKDSGDTVRKPVHIHAEISRMDKVTARLQQELGRLPSAEEIAFKMGITVGKIEGLMRHRKRTWSLDEPIRDDAEAEERGYFIEDLSAVDPYEAAERGELRDLISGMLSKFEQRERQIIELRFGIRGDEPWTLERIGRKFGITRERIRQIEVEVKRKLKEELGDKVKDFLEE